MYKDLIMHTIHYGHEVNMNIQDEKLFLRRVAASWGCKRNIGGLTKKEIQELQALRIQAKVYTKEAEGSMWVLLTEAGQERLYELNGLKDV